MTRPEHLDSKLLPGFDRRFVSIDGNDVLAVVGGAPDPDHEDPDTTYEQGEGASVTTTVTTWGHEIPDHSYTAVVDKVVMEETPEARRRRYIRAGIGFTLDSDGTLIATWAVGSRVANGWETHGNEH